MTTDAEILAEEMAAVTPEMVEAGSRELTRISITRVPDPHRPGRLLTVPARVSEGDMLAAIWRAMLGAKLARGGCS